MSKIYMERCPKCVENYAMNVCTGICTWCGYEATKKMLTEELFGHQIRC